MWKLLHPTRQTWTLSALSLFVYLNNYWLKNKVVYSHSGDRLCNCKYHLQIKTVTISPEVNGEKYAVCGAWVYWMNSLIQDNSFSLPELVKSSRKFTHVTRINCSTEPITNTIYVHIYLILTFNYRKREERKNKKQT